MAVDTGVAAPAPAHTPSDQWRGWWRGVGWTMAIGWVALLVCLPVVGERESSYADLARAVSRGDVSSVEIEGWTPPGDDWRGTRLWRLHWRQGFVDRTAYVTEASSAAAARRAERQGGGERVVVGLEERLHRLRPDLVITAAERDSGLHGGVGAWRLPEWAAYACLALVAGTLVVLVAGPDPRRANRWAWFWILTASPLGVAAYFVLGGPTSLAKAPRPIARRLRGGWGFVWSLVIRALSPLVLGGLFSLGLFSLGLFSLGLWARLPWHGW